AHGCIAKPFQHLAPLSDRALPGVGVLVFEASPAASAQRTIRSINPFQPENGLKQAALPNPILTET
ncbi:MAG TPA: hypothetical protein VJ783_07585, partial [Pirellulales bacterium]|nr:hypothetical protein [Pirellulales bacterium]